MKIKTILNFSGHEIRRMLKEAFPKENFKVKTDRYSLYGDLKIQTTLLTRQENSPRDINQFREVREMIAKVLDYDTPHIYPMGEGF